MNNPGSKLTPSLRKYIKDNLGDETLNKLEQRLIEKYGIGVSQAIKEFSKLEDVVKEFFADGAIGLESKFIHSVEIEPEKNPDNWIAFKNVVVTSIKKSIEENLGKSTANKIELRLMKKFNLTLVKALEDFTTFDNVLREFFGEGAQGLELRCLQSAFKVKSLKNCYNNLNNYEQILAKKFLESFENKDSKQKLESFLIN